MKTNIFHVYVDKFNEWNVIIDADAMNGNGFNDRMNEIHEIFFLYNTRRMWRYK